MKRKSRPGISVPVPVSSPVIESLREVLDYLWESEHQAFYTLPAAEREEHIFHALRQLDRWLSKTEQRLASPPIINPQP